MRIAPVRTARLIVGLVSALAAVARAQVAPQQPAEKLLVLPLAVKTPADSAVSIAIMDVAREKLGGLARYKVMVASKPKPCDALKASDFACDVLLDESQALLLARFLNVNAYTTGALERSGGSPVASPRVRGIGSSGNPAPLPVTNGNPGPPGARRGGGA